MTALVVPLAHVRTGLDLFQCPRLAARVRANACVGYQLRIADGRADAPLTCRGCTHGPQVAAQLGITFVAPGLAS